MPKSQTPAGKSLTPCGFTNSKALLTLYVSTYDSKRFTPFYRPHLRSATSYDGSAVLSLQWCLRCRATKGFSVMSTGRHQQNVSNPATLTPTILGRDKVISCFSPTSANVPFQYVQMFSTGSGKLPSAQLTTPTLRFNRATVPSDAAHATAALPQQVVVFSL